MPRQKVLDIGKWCKGHKRYRCPCGRKPSVPYVKLQEMIVEIIRGYACGRVAVPRATIEARLLTDYGVDRSPRTVRRYLKRLREEQLIVLEGHRHDRDCGYKLAS